MFDCKKEAAALVAQMSLEEKVYQMMHSAPRIERLGIPSYNYWSEALHGVARAGVATMFPQAIAMAATFDPELTETVAAAISTEGRAKYNAFQEEGDHDIFKGLTFWSPNINIFRDPRWGRGQETFGEDPYLTGRMGVAFIRGIQGPDRSALKAAACAKHFAVHSGPEDERHRFNAVCTRYDLWNTYLPAFECAVKEGRVEAVMGAYNRTLGEPCCGSKLLLRDILRDKWGFDGHVVSDCWAIKDFYLHHRVTGGPTESVALAVKNGCDINCGNLFVYALQAVKEGLLAESDLDRAVTRLFTTRMRLGLLGAPEQRQYTAIPYGEVDSPAHRELNLEAARRSVVLLKNDGALPLRAGELKTVGVIGPNADSRRALEGNYEGTASRHITVLQAIQRCGKEAGFRVMYAEGCHLYKAQCNPLGMADDRLAEAKAVARRSDAVVLCLGLDADIEGEENDEYSLAVGGDKSDLELPGRQQALLEAVVAAAGEKPVILVLISGGSLAVSWADQHVSGVVQAFYPGAEGGQAIADILFGRVSPCGKLPVTFYRRTEDLPDFCDYSMDRRTYRYFRGDALYPFGFGLTYSRFSLAVQSTSPAACRVLVTNCGDMFARETVQVYVETPGQRERWNLCGFASVALGAGESEEREIPLSKLAFSRYDENGDPYILAGKHILHIGFTQPDARSCQLYGQVPVQEEITIEEG